MKWGKVLLKWVHELVKQRNVFTNRMHALRFTQNISHFCSFNWAISPQCTGILIFVSSGGLPGSSVFIKHFCKECCVGIVSGHFLSPDPKRGLVKLLNKTFKSVIVNLFMRMNKIGINHWTLCCLQSNRIPRPPQDFFPLSCWSAENPEVSWILWKKAGRMVKAPAKMKFRMS